MSPRPALPIGQHGEISAARRPDGRWRARCWVRDPDGRRREVAAHGRTRASARNRLLDRLAEREAPGAGGELTRDSTVAVLAEFWLANERGQRGASTWERYEDTLYTHVLPALGAVRLGELTTGRVEAALRAISKPRKVTVDTPRGKVTRVIGGPSAGRTAQIVLRMMLATAVRYDVVERNAAEATTPLGQKPGVVQALTVEEVHALRAHVAAWVAGERGHGPLRNPAVGDLFEVLLGSGVRPGEVLALRWVEDVFMTTRRISINGTVKRTKELGLHRQGYPKTTSSERDLTLPRFAVDALERQYERTGGGVYVFANRDGGLWEPANVRRLWRTVRGKKWEQVQLRHTRKAVATIVERELDLEAAAAQLGHAGVTVTRKHYVQRAHEVDFAAALDAFSPLARPNPFGESAD